MGRVKQVAVFVVGAQKLLVMHGRMAGYRIVYYVSRGHQAICGEGVGKRKG